MNIVWLTTAECDLDALIDYIAENNPQTAIQIFQRINTSIKKLSKFPYLGREGRIEKTRELVIPQLPFVVVYTIAKEIRILAILHTSRKWPVES